MAASAPRPRLFGFSVLQRKAKPMVDTAVTLKNRVESILRKKPELAVERAADRPTLLIATIDPEIRSGLSELFQGFSLNTIWREGVEAAKNVLASERIA